MPKEIGFFTRVQLKGKKKPKTNSLPKELISFDTIRKQGCSACPLRGIDLITPEMKPTGAKNPLVYILGEAPGKDEDRNAEQFIGRSGRLLRKQFPVKYKDKLRFNNCIRCHPPGNRAPTQIEMECCRYSVEDDIEASKPLAIIGTGAVPLSWMIEGLSGITKWRGRRIPVKIGKHRCWYYPILHPAYILRVQNSGGKKAEIPGAEWSAIFSKDIRQVFSDLETPEKNLPSNLPENLDNLYEGVSWITGNNKGHLDLVLNMLNDFTKSPAISLDIETNHIRPYYKDAKVLTVAIADDKESFAFPLEHPQAGWTAGDLRKLMTALYEFLVRQDTTQKIVQNLGFEMEWFLHLFGNKVLLNQPSSWEDTMQQAYCLDGRRHTHSLEFLTIQNFGFNLKKQSSVEISKLEFTDLEEVLKYNALDAKYQYKLFVMQNKRIVTEELEEPYISQLERTPTFVLAQREGVLIDTKQVEIYEKRFSREAKEITAKIMHLPEVAEYEKQYKEFNPNSPKQLLTLFKNILKRKEIKQGNRYTTDEGVLSQMKGVKLAELVLELRGAQKAKSTYVEPLIPGHSRSVIYADNRVHTSFLTTSTETKRTSSTKPNLQNQEKRKRKYLRSMFIPPLGYKIASFDYGQIEARVIAMMSKDKVLVEALWNDYDIHMEWAEKVVALSPAKLKKEGTIDKVRTAIKNELVFPGFYGAKMESIANNLEVSKRDFKLLFDEFWEMFAGVGAWQRLLMKLYKELGYVEGLTGFRRRAPLSKNMVINSPVQGTASDIVVDAMNRLSRISLEENKPELQAVINIHDDLTFFLSKKTLDESIERIVLEMVDVPWDWVNVPISVEISVGDNWADMEKIGIFKSNELI